jgi:cell division transport system permease protein
MRQDEVTKPAARPVIDGEATGHQERVVDQNMHGLFERALAAEPVPPPGDLARTAMTHGTRLRRRRRLVAGGSAAGVVAVLATIVALNVAAPAGRQHPPTAAAQSMCSSAARPANDVSIVLRDDISDAQRGELNAALRSDPLVRDVRFESHEQAYVRFEVLWRNSPEFAKSVRADELPESFRVTLRVASAYPEFLTGIENMGGIDSILGGACPPSPAAREGE